MKRLFSAFRLLIAVAVTFTVTFFVTAYVLNATGLRTFDPTTDLTAVVVVTSTAPSSVAAQVLKNDTLPMGTEEALRFYGNNNAHPGYVLNAKGLWAFGRTIVLTQPDGAVHRLNFLNDDAAPGQGINAAQEGSQYVAIGLDDDSVLVLHKQRGIESAKFYRVTLQGGKAELALQHLTLAPKLGNGIAVVKLADGRVLVAGGRYTETQAWLYNARQNKWDATGNMNVGRMYTAIAALPDGRAFVAGNSWISAASDSNNIRLGIVYGAELWDPRTGLWTALPSLPLSFKITAHHATGPSAAALPDGSLVVGGGMHRHVVLLRAKGKSFAPYWTIAGSTPGHRVSGIVQALGNNEVAVLGGVAPLPNDGGCCRRQTGGDRIVWTGDGTGRDRSLSLGRKEAAVAHRGDITFAAGGSESFGFSFQTTQASAVAELIDHRNGRVRTLSPLPHPSFAGRAIWLDDDRVLVKAVASKSHSSLEHDSNGFLSIYSLSRNSWSTLDDPRIAWAELAGISGNEVILVSPDAKVWAVTPDNVGVRELPRLVLARKDGVGRVLPDGRFVVAGGKAQSEVIQAIDADCKRPDCPVRNFGYGGLQPSRRHEIFDPATGLWRLSAASQGAGESAVIRRDGRVVELGRVSRNSQTDKDPSTSEPNLLIEESNVPGTIWHGLPLPVGLNETGSHVGSSCWGGDGNTDEKCTLLIGERPDVLSDAVFFLRARWDNTLRGERYDLWVLADDATQWVSVTTGLTEEQLLVRQTLPQRVGGKTVYASSFQPHKVRIWVE
jgi:hypothetical protein